MSNYNKDEKKAILKENEQLMGDRGPLSRFGTAVANVVTLGLLDGALTNNAVVEQAQKAGYNPGVGDKVYGRLFGYHDDVADRAANFLQAQNNGINGVREDRASPAPRSQGDMSQALQAAQGISISTDLGVSTEGVSAEVNAGLNVGKPASRVR